MRMPDPGTRAGNQASAMTALLEAVAAHGDRTAFAALFEHFAPRIKAYLRRLGAADGEAEELAQEAMLSAWRKAGQFDPAKASAGTWLFTIARNLRIDALRKERRPELDPEDPAWVPDPEPAADDRLHGEQRSARLRAALDYLPEDQVTVVKMSFFDDKPHSLIARELGIPMGTVKSRLRLAMRRLRQDLGEIT